MVLVEMVGHLRLMVRVEIDNSSVLEAQKYEFAGGAGIVPEPLTEAFGLRLRLNSFVPW